MDLYNIVYKMKNWFYPTVGVYTMGLYTNSVNLSVPGNLLTLELTPTNNELTLCKQSLIEWLTVANTNINNFN